jgi:hypothetical protein
MRESSSPDRLVESANTLSADGSITREQLYMITRERARVHMGYFRTDTPAKMEANGGQEKQAQRLTNRLGAGDVVLQPARRTSSVLNYTTATRTLFAR